MKTLDQFCQFMEEYLDEAVYARGGIQQSTRFDIAGSKALGTYVRGTKKVTDSYLSASASQAKKERDQGRHLEKSSNKALGKLHDLRKSGPERAKKFSPTAESPYILPDDYTLKGN